MFRTLEDIYKTKKDLVIFDIGAHNFSDSLNFKSKYPEADVYAFEPDIHNISLYAQAAKEKGIIVYEHALGDVNGKLRFFPSDSYGGIRWTASGSIIEPATKENSSEGINHGGLYFNLEGYEIECRTLESFCTEMGIEHIDYIHMDVQGAEYKVLQHMGKIRPYLLRAETCEWTTYKTGINIDIFDELLKSLGYSILSRDESDTVYTHSSNV